MAVATQAGRRLRRGRHSGPLTASSPTTPEPGPTSPRRLVSAEIECWLYHVNGDAELSNRELTAAILEACGASWDMVVPVNDRKGHDRRYSLDDSLLRSMGYAPQVTFSDGLKLVI